MRTPHNDTIGEPDRAGRRGQHVPERRCVLTGETASADRLVRLALGPDGQIGPDVLGKAPGRGAWIGVARDALETAMAKGKLKGALARTLKEARLDIPADLGERIAAQLERATLDRLGLEARAGTLLTGTDKIETAARSGKVALLLHASDAAADGRKKLAQAWRVGTDSEGSGQMGAILPADRSALSMALGRENAVHLALTDPRAAERVNAVLRRWQFFTGWGRDAANPDLPGAGNSDAMTVLVDDSANAAD